MTFISKPLLQVASFLVLKLPHTYAGPHPNRGLKKDILAAKKAHVLLKNVLFKLNFQDEGHLDSNFLIYILTNHCVNPILTGFQKGHISGTKVLIIC